MYLLYLLLSCQSDPAPPKENIWIPGWEFTPQSYREAELNIEAERWSISTSEGAFSFRLMTESKYKGQEKVEKAIDSWVWNETKQELSSTHRIAEMNWRFHVDIQDTHLQLRIEVDGNETKEIQRERLWLEVEAIDIEHLGRDYRWRSLEKRYALDRWTPQYLRLYTADGMIRMRGEAESVWLEEREGRYRIALELSHQANHPLKIFRKCYAQYEEAQEEERVNRYAQPSRFVRKANISLSLNEGPLLEPLRYPHRYKAAISFNDHADQSNLLKLKALMLGTSTEVSENKKGFAGHGLSMSKSIFVREAKGYDRQGSLGPYVDLLEEIQNTSTQEIGLHSVSGEVDNRTQTEAGLAFAEILQSMGGGRFWIDHQPSTNCEAISNEGGGYRRGARSQYQIVDLLKEYGYHYVWAGFDLPPPADGINLFDPERPENRSPVLYTHSGIDSAGAIFLFSSLWRAKPFSSFLDDFSSDKLNRLVEDRGLHIAHTYLDTYAPGSHTETWTLLERQDGQYVLRDEAEKLFAELGVRQKKGDIWVAGIVAIGDHLRGMERLIIEDHQSGFTIMNPRDEPVEGASFRLSGLTKEPLIMLDHVALPEEQYSWDTEGFSFSMDVQADTLHRIDVVSQEMSMLDRWTWKIRANAGE